MPIRAVPDNGLALIFALKSGTGPCVCGEAAGLRPAASPFKIIIRSRFKIIIAAARIAAAPAGRIRGLFGSRYTSRSHGYAL